MFLNNSVHLSDGDETLKKSQLNNNLNHVKYKSYVVKNCRILKFNLTKISLIKILSVIYKNVDKPFIFKQL